MFTLSGVCYGDYPGLADRCLRSIWSSLGEGRQHVRDIRWGLNEPGDATRRIVHWFGQHVSRQYGISVRIYECQQNAFKYPLMRRMLLPPETEPATHVMWFDDDSFLSGELGWWQRVRQAADASDMLGKLYYVALLGDQPRWIKRQPWYAGVAFQEFNRRPSMKFATGGWWSIRAEILRKWDWPCVELKHRGGDSTLGELCRQQGYRLINFEEGVRINADDKGLHSKAPRRGPPVGLLGMRLELHPDLSHQQFDCTVTTYI